MIIGHLVNPNTKEWFHYDDRYRLWTCDCKDEKGVELCLSVCDCLKNESELREVKRQIAIKKKELDDLSKRKM